MGAIARALPSSTATSALVASTKRNRPAAAGLGRIQCARSLPSSTSLARDGKYEPSRRVLTWGAIGTLLSLSVTENASAAKRRPPAQEETPKNDPNVSGVQAKVLASKKRKEAMKEAMAKLRERGKPVNQLSSAPQPTPEPPSSTPEPTLESPSSTPDLPSPQ
ncbi:uncharacterized protein LOC116247055 [Nymphaea colorata]|nr:uncharacterized protein LOC116247055 [Nymphaea colorata]